MKYYSEITKKMYETEEELLNAEKAATEDYDAYVEKRDNLYKEFKEARKKYDELMTELYRLQQEGYKKFGYKAMIKYTDKKNIKGDNDGDKVEKPLNNKADKALDELELSSKTIKDIIDFIFK